VIRRAGEPSSRGPGPAWGCERGESGAAPARNAARTGKVKGGAHVNTQAATAKPAMEAWIDAVKWTADGLVPAIAQDAGNGKVLTLAWMNREALALTAKTSEVHYWSRSRAALWRKGEQSGHVQTVREIRLDCDNDAILLLVEPAGGIACHTGRERCFFQRLEQGRWVDVEPVLEDPQAIYGHG